MTVEKAVHKILKNPNARPTINHHNGNFSLRIGELNHEEAIILMLDDEDITGITTPRGFDSLCAWISDRIDGHGTRYRYAKPTNKYI